MQPRNTRNTRKTASSGGVLLVTLFFPLFAAARLVVEPVVYDFGEAESGKAIEAYFVLTNMGDESMSIQRVVPSSPDMTVAFLGDSIAPGNATVMTVQFDLNGYSGSIEHDLVLETDHPRQPRTRAAIRGVAQNYLYAWPNPVCLGILPRGITADEVLWLIADDGQSFRILEIVSSSPLLGVHVAELEEEDVVGYQLILTARAEWNEQDVRETVRIKTDHPRKPELDLVVVSMIIALTEGEPEKEERSENE